MTNTDKKQTKWVCQVCGALFVEGEGFVEEHYFPCYNDAHNSAWCREVSLNWERPPEETSDEYMATLAKTLELI